jgi:F-type H+-transporting ATPase subunit b
MVDERNEHICHSLEAAEEANSKLRHINEESEALLNEARLRQNEILKKATNDGTRIVEEAKEHAAIETERRMEDALRQIEVERRKAIDGIRREVARISVDIAEKILRRELDHSESQQALVNKLLEEVETDIGMN